MEVGLEIQKTNAEIRITILEILCVPIFNEHLWLFRPKFTQKWILGSEYLCPDRESRPPNYHVCRFLSKMDNFEFFGLDLGKFPN